MRGAINESLASIEKKYFSKHLLTCSVLKTLKAENNKKSSLAHLIMR